MPRRQQKNLKVTTMNEKEILAENLYEQRTKEAPAKNDYSTLL